MVLVDIPPVQYLKRVIYITDRVSSWDIYFLDGSEINIHKTECEKDGFSINDARNSLCNYELDLFREQKGYE